jgi:internalin A
VPDQTKMNTGRRWLRISIRALMALVLIIACALGWIVNRARVQRIAVVAVRKAGGTVWYDFEHRRGPGPRPGLRRWQRLIANAIGVDFVGSVTLVSMPVSGSKADCRTILARLGDFDRLEYVDLIGRWVEDDALASLRGQHRLRSLVLQHTRITEAGLAHLEGFTSLQKLYISGDITDRGLARVARLTSLDQLRLNDTQITDTGLCHFRALPNLKSLALEHTRVTDASIPELKRLVGLSRLSLHRTEITTEGIGELKKSLAQTVVVPSNPRESWETSPP